MTGKPTRQELLLTAVALCIAAGAWAQSTTYPVRPVRMVIAPSPGAVGSIAAEIVQGLAPIGNTPDEFAKTIGLQAN